MKIFYILYSCNSFIFVVFHALIDVFILFLLLSGRLTFPLVHTPLLLIDLGLKTGQCLHKDKNVWKALVDSLLSFAWND